MPVHDWTRVFAGAFHDFHYAWVAEIRKALNGGLLPSDYYAMAEQVTGPGNPDVLTLQTHQPRPTSLPPPSAGAVALLDESPPAVRYTSAAAEAGRYARQARRLAVRHASDHRVVAVVEVVSPGNKAARAEFRAFVDKSVSLLAAGVHLLVLDLFPPGKRDPTGPHDAIWGEFADEPYSPPADKPLTLAAYSAGDVKRAFVNPVGVGDPLPDMPLFLTPDRYVRVPLEATYRLAWDSFPWPWQQAVSG
jgi:hypothetical protein